MKDSKIIKTKIIFEKHSKKFVKETLKLSDGNNIDWYYLDSPKSVIIVPITKKGKVILVRQYRYNLSRYVYEFPAGFTKNPKETTFLQAAKTELFEETGYKAEKFIDLGIFYNLPSETNRWTKIYLATNAKRVTHPKLDNIIEKYFDISIKLIDFGNITKNIGKSNSRIKSIEHSFALRLAAEHLKSC